MSNVALYLRYAKILQENYETGGMHTIMAENLSISTSRDLDSLYNYFVRLSWRDRKIFVEQHPDIVKELYFYAKSTNQNTSVFTEHEYSEVAA
tara:strand:+ start:347 stop:625 length:279 start_codon:yes stop_codon:yes gene_type:complete